MNKENKLVPKLRFPEFVNEGEWDLKVLSKITDAIFDGTHQTPTYVECGIPFFSVENIVSGNKNKYISKEDYELATNVNKPQKGDILITRIGKIGFSAIVSWEYEFSIYVTLACIKKSEQFDSYYLHCYFQSSAYQKEILSKSLLNAVPCKINMNELRETKVLLPKEIKEQQKIASCLSSLDELITAHTDKLEALRDHKKGLMQQLFPAEGETLPKLRFKEFEKDGEWVETKISSIGYVVTGSTPSKDDGEFWDGDFVWITAQDFKDKYISNSALKLTQKGKNKSRIIPTDSVLVTCIASIGLNAINKIECATNQQINAIVCNDNNFFEFIYYVIEYNKNRLKNLAGQTAVPIINKTVFESFEIKIPKVKAEQQKIANFLSSIDDEITAQTQKIEALKEHKKGLMQGLFPVINE